MVMEKVYCTIAPLKRHSLKKTSRSYKLYPCSGVIDIAIERMPNEPIELGMGVFVDETAKYLDHQIYNHPPLYDYFEIIAQSKHTLGVINIFDFPEKMNEEIKRDKISDLRRKAISRIWIASLALWLAKATGIGFDQVIHLHDKGIKSKEQIDHSWQAELINEFPQIIPHGSYAEATLSNDDLVLAKKLNIALGNTESNRVILTAVDILWKALTTSFGEVRLLLLWVVLEALFGPEDGREITFRIAQRIAFFLESDRSISRDIFVKVKKSYSVRSKVAHGAKISKISIEDLLMHILELEEWVRHSLIKILKDLDITKIFKTSDVREKYLDELIYEP